MISFIVPGRPRPKQRPRIGRNGAVYTPRETRDYERFVGWCALQAMGGEKPIAGPVALEALFYFKNCKTPDLDNCIKALLDGLQGVVFQNDRQVQKQSYEMRFDKEERVEVRIWELEEAG